MRLSATMSFLLMTAFILAACVTPAPILIFTFAFLALACFAAMMTFALLAAPTRTVNRAPRTIIVDDSPAIIQRRSRPMFFEPAPVFVPTRNPFLPRQHIVTSTPSRRLPTRGNVHTHDNSLFGSPTRTSNMSRHHQPQGPSHHRPSEAQRSQRGGAHHSAPTQTQRHRPR